MTKYPADPGLLPKIVRVVAEDIETGEDGERLLAAGEYVVIPVEPLYLHSTARHANGTVVLTLKRRPTGTGEAS